MKPSALIGEKATRQHVLSDGELRAVWQTADLLGYPYGPLIHLLMLTGARRAEVAEARWSEFDLEKRVWTIPAARFKSGSAHFVPLSDAAMSILNDLPRFVNGDYLFSSKSGKSPVRAMSVAITRLNTLLAKLDVPPAPWVVHDLRRTVRTRLSGLRVPEPVAEMVIGHARKGLARVYDQHQYLDEMREALDLWAGRLRDIVEPPPANVVKLARA